MVALCQARLWEKQNPKKKGVLQWIPDTGTYPSDPNGYITAGVLALQETVAEPPSIQTM